MTTSNQLGAMMTDKIKYFLEAWEMNGVGKTVATVQDSPGTVVTITVDDLRALLSASKPAASDGWRKGQWGYQTLFNAIGDAVTVNGAASVSISVQAFEDSMLAAAPAAPAQSGEAVAFDADAAIRLRHLCRLLGLKTAIPSDDASLMAVQFSVFGMMRAKIERLAAPQPTQPAKAGEVNQTPFSNCRFQICDLPGQCRGEGKCHHPAVPAASQSAVVLDGERAAFEREMLSPKHGFKPNKLTRLGDGYFLGVLDFMWKGWQTRAASPQATAMQPEHSAIYISKRLTGSDKDASFVQAHINQAVSEAMEHAASSQAKATLTDAWVSVDERLPDAPGDYLLYRPFAHLLPGGDPNVTIREFLGRDKPGSDKFGGAHAVTHWMPLPKAPAAAQPASGGDHG